MSKLIHRPLLWGLLTVAGTLASAHAAPQAKPAAKSQAKPAGVLGMVPMAGVEGKIGQAYTIGQESPLNFTLNSAEYTLERVNFGDDTVAPEKEEKLLVLRYTVHNPQKEERHFDWGTLNFTAVDAMNTNREYEQFAGGKETGDILAISLKPAQKVEAYGVIRVPAKGVIPKLIVKPQLGGVIRYDLRGVVKALSAPFADAADKSGATALTDIPAQLNTYYPLQRFDIKLLETTYADTLGETVPEEGHKFFVAKFSIRNGTKGEHSFDWASFKPEAKDADGETLEWTQTLLKATRNESSDGGTLKPGQEYTARYYFSLPKDASAKTFTISEGESHSYVFAVGNTK
jgi:hypothetical protein